MQTVSRLVLFSVIKCPESVQVIMERVAWLGLGLWAAGPGLRVDVRVTMTVWSRQR